MRLFIPIIILKFVFLLRSSTNILSKRIYLYILLDLGRCFKVGINVTLIVLFSREPFINWHSCFRHNEKETVGTIEITLLAA